MLLLRSLIASLVVVGCAVLVGSAHAGESYVSAFAGSAFPEDEISSEVGIFDSDFDFEARYVVGGALGYQLEPTGFGYFRVEVEGAYRFVEDDESNAPSSFAFNTGEIEVYTVFLNASYNFDFFEGALVPYFGGGIGFAHVNVDLSSVGLNATNTTIRTSGSSTDFAWQVVAGVSSNPLPFVDVFVEGRYFQAEGVSGDSEQILFPAENSEPEETFKSDLDISQASVVAGLRFAF